MADARYHQVVFEQYKLCVEMTERVSARRPANTFFLSLNSAVVAVVVAVGGTKAVDTSAWLLTARLVMCRLVGHGPFVLAAQRGQVRGHRRLRVEVAGVRLLQGGMGGPR
ncbi:hypothetical protein ACF1AU_05765 [Streptomyces rubrogriseus]|uniref:RipA family octameric membrane protein n=1 Tax=Streptomyces rubrogriseus TaxID=194673 RepID=UPI0036F87E94